MINFRTTPGLESGLKAEGHRGACLCCSGCDVRAEANVLVVGARAHGLNPRKGTRKTPTTIYLHRSLPSELQVVLQTFRIPSYWGCFSSGSNPIPHRIGRALSTQVVAMSSGSESSGLVKQIAQESSRRLARIFDAFLDSRLKITPKSHRRPRCPLLVTSNCPRISTCSTAAVA